MNIKPFSSHSNKGKQAEKLACDYLKDNGLTLIDKNFNSRFGEIDLIMQHQDATVFIEVRYRKNMDYGGAKASINYTKQQKIRKTALYYMQKLGHELNARFDVIAITGENKKQNIEWIKNAF